MTNSFTKRRINSAIAWIDALKANEYKQGIGKLGDAESGYCCLGVGCLVAGVSCLPQNKVASEAMRDKTGLRNETGVLKRLAPAFDVSVGQGCAPLRALTMLNDIARLPFSEIAEHMIARADDLFEEDVAEGITAHYTQAI